MCGMHYYINLWLSMSVFVQKRTLVFCRGLKKLPLWKSVLPVNFNLSRPMCVYYSPIKHLVPVMPKLLTAHFGKHFTQWFNELFIVWIIASTCKTLHTDFWLWSKKRQNKAKHIIWVWNCFRDNFMIFSEIRRISGYCSKSTTAPFLDLPPFSPLVTGV